MSVDAYFCFCCLSTNDLKNLFSEKPDTNYALILEDLFSVKLLQEEYEYDSYICDDCAKRLLDAQMFKRQVLDTLNALQVNGLIKMTKNSDHRLITKMSNEYVSDADDKYNLNKAGDEKPNEEGAQVFKYPSPIKVEQETNAVVLEREKRITVSRKKKKEPTVKHEVPYEVTEDLKCTICAAEMPNVYVYHAHMNRHFPNHICETCGKGHVASSTCPNLPALRKVKSAEKKRRKILGSFLTKKRLKRHMPSHFKGPFKCEECDTEFSNYNTLNSHRQRKHKTVELYACPHCPERFGTLTRRARHLAAEHGALAPHRCHLCAKRFLLAGNLSTHMRNKHLKIKRHFCVECGAGFFHKQELRGHLAAHTGRNEHQCTQCPKSYPRKKALDVHMRTHKDDRRFCCDQCGKKFLQKCTLITHAKTHSRTESQVTQEQNAFTITLT